MPALTTFALAAALFAPRQDHSSENEAERLHRKGVFCMEAIERPDCAMDRFEALMEVRTMERELVTDGMLRLVKLYRAYGEADKIKPLLRGFWDVGVKHRQTGHVPWSTRFIPEQADMMFMISVQDILNAPITKRMGPDARAWVTTCDPGQRELLSERRRWKRAEIRAKETGKTPIEVIYEEQDRQRARRPQARKRPPSPPPGADKTPIFVETLCPLARALGDQDVGQWGRMVGAMSHEDFSISAGVVHIPELERRLTEGLKSGALTRQGDNLYALTDSEYEGGPVQLANTDQDELVVASHTVMPGIVEARRHGGRTMGRKLYKLMSEIPRDVEFFFVMTEEAMLGLGAGSMSAGQRGILRALLPQPKGFQMSAVAHDYFGVFLRMPTDNAVKGALLVSLAQRLISSDDAEDPAQRELMEQLDVAQANDKRALLLSYVLDAAQVRKIFFY